MFHTSTDDTVVWRYLDFEKFVDLITSHELFFCRSDKFEDPFEGILKLPDSLPSEIERNSLTKKFYFLNCWHINEFQSAAMWKLFLKTNNGIAIKTTVGKIKKSISNNSEEVFISKVYYKDFSNTTHTDLMDDPLNRYPNSASGGSYSQFNYKRKSFEHEQELRLIYIDMPIPHALKDGIPREPIESKKISVVLEDLIQEIMISPTADDWFKELITRLLTQLKLRQFKVQKSNLYELE